MKYMLLIAQAQEDQPADEAEAARRFEGWMGYSAELAEAGVMVAGEALVPADQAVTADLRTHTVTDGPFAETKEVIGGFYVVDVPDRDTAVAWAQKMPPYVSVEVRECMVFDQ